MSAPGESRVELLLPGLSGVAELGWNLDASQRSVRVSIPEQAIVWNLSGSYQWSEPVVSLAQRLWRSPSPPWQRSPSLAAVRWPLIGAALMWLGVAAVAKTTALPAEADGRRLA